MGESHVWGFHGGRGKRVLGGAMRSPHLPAPWYGGYERKQPQSEIATREAASSAEPDLCSRSFMFQITQTSNNNGTIKQIIVHATMM